MTMPLPMIDDTEFRWQPDDEASFGSLKTVHGHLPLRALNVHTEISGLVARTTVRQTFVNTYDEPVEATYIFPLPSRAAVTHFAMEVNGRVIEGQLKERGQARQEYSQAIAQGHRAAIAEQERPDVFTIRAGNLTDRDVAVVELVMIAPLDVVDGEVTWRFPLVVAPRFMPGRPLGGDNVGDGVATDTDAVPDASRISPPVLLGSYPNPVQLSLQVDIHAGGRTLSNVRSSLHAVDVLKSSSQASVRVQPGERINRDFILRFELAGASISHAAMAQIDPAREGQHVFELSLMAPKHIAVEAQPRDVVFILDRSGSMHGWKMIAARRAMARMLDTLTPKDKFLFMAFDHTIETVPELRLEMSEATNRNRYRALEFIAKVDAEGSTEMARPLDIAAKKLQDSAPGRRRTIVLVTDGQVGNEDQILRQLEPYLSDVHVYTVGIDRAVNEGFLTRLAQVGGGRFELVESEDRLDDAMDRIHRMIDTPVLQDVQIDALYAGINKSELVPKRLPDLFAGTPLVIAGRLTNLQSHSMLRVRAKTANGESWHVDVPIEQHNGSGLAAVWARAKLRQYEDEYVMARGSQTTALAQTMTELSLAYRVLCRFTSFVAVDRDQKIERSAPLRQVTQAVEQPSGWGASNGPTHQSGPQLRGMIAPIGAPAPGGFGAPPAPMPASPMAPQPMSARSPMMSGAMGEMEDMEFEEAMTSSVAFDSFSSIDSMPEERVDHNKGRRSREKKKSMAPPKPAPSKTQVGSQRTKTEYLSVEIMASKTLTVQTHVYVLAVMLYEALTGRQLFGDDTFQRLQAALKKQLPEPLWRDSDPALAHALTPFIRRAVGIGSPYEDTVSFARDISSVLTQPQLQVIDNLLLDWPTQADASAPVLLAGYRAMSLISDREPFDRWLAQDNEGRWVVASILHAHMVFDSSLLQSMTNPLTAHVDGVADYITHGLLSDGRWCVIREHVPGWTLRRVMSRKGMDDEATVRVIAQVAEHLEVLRQHGFIHRELAPEDVVVLSTGEAMISCPVTVALQDAPKGFFQRAKDWISGRADQLAEPSEPSEPEAPTRRDFWK